MAEKETPYNEQNPSDDKQLRSNIEREEVLEDVLEDLKEKGRNSPYLALLQQTSISLHSHPVPPPHVLKEYAELDPELGRLFPEQFKENSQAKSKQAEDREDPKVSNEFELEKQRLNNEKQKDNNDHKQKRLVIILVFVFLISLILLSAVSLLLGHEKVGIGTSIAGGLSIIGIVLREIFLKKKS